MSVASVVLFNRYALSGNGEFGKKITEALSEAPIHSGRKYIELFIDAETGKFLEVLSHSPARIFHQSLSAARRSNRHTAPVTVLTLMFDASSHSLVDIALLERVSAAAYEALTALPERPDTSTRFAA